MRPAGEVRRLAAAVPAVAGRAVRVGWDGLEEEGGRAPEGVYRVRVALRKGGRAVTIGPRLWLDTTAPRPTVFAGGPEGREWITGPVAGPVPFRVRVVSRRFPTRVRVLRTDAGRPAEVSAFELPPGEREGEWDGRTGDGPAPPGSYQLVAAVRDVAGNVGRSAPAGQRPGTIRGAPGVSVRGLLARPPADPVRAGEMVPFAVDSRGRPYRWRVFRVGETKPRSKGRKASGGELKVRAPQGSSGLYVLDVRTAKRSTSVPFAVQDATAAPILVVLPAVTWFGADTLDDDRDGLPNTLENGSSAAYPRLLAGGLPDGFSDQVAPLLAFLDRQKVNYDITTDLTLAASRAGLSGERAGGAARRSAALDLDRGRAAAAPLRDRRRQPGVVRRRLDAARRRDRARPAAAAAAADRRRPVRHRAAPGAQRGRHAAPARADRGRPGDGPADRRRAAVRVLGAPGVAAVRARCAWRSRRSTRRRSTPPRRRARSRRRPIRRSRSPRSARGS